MYMYYVFYLFIGSLIMALMVRSVFSTRIQAAFVSKESPNLEPK